MSVSEAPPDGTQLIQELKVDEVQDRRMRQITRLLAVITVFMVVGALSLAVASLTKSNTSLRVSGAESRRQLVLANQRLEDFSDMSACRSQLAAAGDVLFGPVVAAFSRAVNDTNGLVATAITEDRVAFENYAAALQADAANFSEVYLPYQDALDKRAQADVLCAQSETTTSSEPSAP